MIKKQLRDRSWELLWRRAWFWRFFAASFLLQLVAHIIVRILDGMLHRIGVCSFSRIGELASSREELLESAPDMCFELALSCVLYFFICLVFTGIVEYGMAMISNRAAEDDSEKYLKSAFGGFKIPLDLAWLKFREVLIFAGWTFLAILPGIFLVSSGCGSVRAVAASAVFFVLALALVSIPFYRYRYLFRIKADNPEWSAGECLRHCRLLSSGEKWRMFKFDCSYWRMFLVPLILLAAALSLVCWSALSAQSQQFSGGVAAAVFFVVIIMYLAAVFLMVAAGFSNSIGHSILYREISRERRGR